MKFFFVKAAHPEPIRSPFGEMAIADNWQRPLGVAMAFVLAALLHGLLLLWYLNRPAPLAYTEAMALPMIDIALTARHIGAPAKAFAPPVPPKPVIKPPEKKPVPKVKPKPLVKPKERSEIKKPLVKREDKPMEPAPSAATAASPSATTAAMTTAPTVSNTQSGAEGTDVPANANANYLSNPKPDYPELATRHHWEGRVILRVYVTADGRCGDLSVYRSSGHDVLDESAMAAVKQWRFVPGKHGDTAIASWVNVPIEFALE